MSESKQPIPLFVIDPDTDIKWPVTVSLPADGGETATFQFTGIFRRMSDADLDKLLGVDEAQQIEPAQGDELAHGQLPAKRMQEVLRENAELFPQILVGWEAVKTSAGVEVAFSVDLLKEQVTGVNGRFLSAGLWKAIAEIRNGVRLGN